MNPNITSLTISFPNWFYVVCSATFIAVIFCAGFHWKAIHEICKEFPKVREALTRISEILLQKKFAKEPLFTAASPLRLTPNGEEMITGVKFQDFYNTNKKVLLERINKFNPKNMADLEEACKNVMLPIEDTLPGFELVKQFAYNTGIPIGKILFVCAIKLRDMMAQELQITS